MGNAAKGGKDVAKYPGRTLPLKIKRDCSDANFNRVEGNDIDDGFAYTAPVDVFARKWLWTLQQCRKCC